MFDSAHDEYDTESDDFENPYRNIKSKNESLKSLYFNAMVIEEHEIVQLSRIFPNLEYLAIDAENVLTERLNLKDFKNL